jgi:hypothetical protein
MKDQIIQTLFEVIDETNRQNSGAILEKSAQTALYGSDSALDSLGLINFVVATEEKIEKVFGKSIVLADDRALSQAVSPFTSVDTLASYIEKIIQD